MKTPKPGQLCTINNVVYRAKRRDIESIYPCTGCALDNLLLCPNIVGPKLECSSYGIILVRV